jgi:DNA-binding transcriptional ArsR family regulator
MPRETNGSKAEPQDDYSELERLSALETLKALAKPEEVKLADLVDYLEQRQLWPQFSKITLADLKEAFGRGGVASAAATEAAAEVTNGLRKRKKRILEDELGVEAPSKEKEDDSPADGGISTDEIAAQVIPFIEGNGDVTFEEIAEYISVDRKVLRYHLGVLVKASKLERIGVGKTAVYSTTG